MKDADLLLTLNRSNNRLFLRHVLTSERMWGGMVTVIIEPETDEASLNLIRAYCDVIDLRKQEVANAND